MKRNRTGTYRDIQDHVRERHGVEVKTCWIAHVKELVGLHPRQAPNRQGTARNYPCPSDKRPLIEDALRHFGKLSH